MQLNELSVALPIVGLVLSLFFLAAIFYRLYYYKPLYYRYPLTDYLKSKHTSYVLSHICFYIRIALLITIMVLSMGLRSPDERSFIKAEGIDIIMTLDVSGSMQAVDDLNNPIERLEAAKKQVSNFIKQRSNDYIGLVIFAKNALCRCPLTMDKSMLCKIVDEISLGIIETDGTALAHGMLLSAQKIAHSTAKSKVMIVLTDGNPSAHDIALKPVIELINQLNIRVYMIGIGNSLDRAYIKYPGIGFVAHSIPLNFELLSSIAHATKGKAFLAQNPDQIAQAYALIDALEKTQKDVPVFNIYKNYFKQGVYAALLLIVIEWFLSTFVWLYI